MREEFYQYSSESKFLSGKDGETRGSEIYDMYAPSSSGRYSEGLLEIFLGPLISEDYVKIIFSILFRVLVN